MSSWRPSLKEILERDKLPPAPTRLAIVGIGNELNGDDAAGVLVTRSIDLFLKDTPQVKVFEAGQALENITGALIRYKPDAILFIDAISMGAEAGSIHILDWQSSQGFSASTHSLPLKMVVEYILHEHPCQVHLLGIQISDTSMGVEVTGSVKSATRQIVNAIKSSLVG